MQWYFWINKWDFAACIQPQIKSIKECWALIFDNLGFHGISFYLYFSPDCGLKWMLIFSLSSRAHAWCVFLTPWEDALAQIRYSYKRFTDKVACIRFRLQGVVSFSVRAAHKGCGTCHHSTVYVWETHWWSYPLMKQVYLLDTAWASQILGWSFCSLTVLFPLFSHYLSLWLSDVCINILMK